MQNFRSRFDQISCNDEKSLEGALQTFERFHSRQVGKGVFPFHKRQQGVFKLPEYVQFPDHIGLFGIARRSWYESDKWNPLGDTVLYYHDHVGKAVKFYVPLNEDNDLREAHLPYKWPEEVSLIGKCIALVVKEGSNRKVTELRMQGNNILAASPDGWVDRRRPDRVFLVVINLNGGGVEGVIAGGKLRITSHGIEG
jgi:hypothetical protein